MQTIPILYATFTGSTQEAATSLLRSLEREYPKNNFKLQNVSSYKAGDLINCPLVIFGASTWEVDLNPDNLDFFKKLEQEKPDFSKVTFALFGLGDKYYEIFCAAQPVIEKTLKSYGAHVYPKQFAIDGYPTPHVLNNLRVWAVETILDFQKQNPA